MEEQIIIHGIPVIVKTKAIQHTYIRIYDNGKVVVTTPHKSNSRKLYKYLRDNLKNRNRLNREIINKPTTCRLWGKDYPLEVKHDPDKSYITFNKEKNCVELQVSKFLPVSEYTFFFNLFYERKLSAKVEQLLPIWCQKLGVEVSNIQYRAMRTRWGSCRYESRRITLNTDLAQYPLICTEYMLVHELIQLLEDGHGPNFYAILERHLPNFREASNLLDGITVD